MTSSRWIRPPIVYAVASPSNHRTRRTMKMIQSMFPHSFLRGSLMLSTSKKAESELRKEFSKPLGSCPGKPFEDTLLSISATNLGGRTFTSSLRRYCPQLHAFFLLVFYGSYIRDH